MYDCKDINKDIFVRILKKAFTFHKILKTEIVRKNAAIQTFTTKRHKFILLINS